MNNQPLPIGQKITSPHTSVAKNENGVSGLDEGQLRTPESTEMKERISEHVTKYNSLSPTDNIEKSKYFEPIKWALDNAETENIKNIALTGPYGAGKSTVIRSFIKSQSCSDKYHFLTISLATFKEEEDAISHKSQIRQSNGTTPDAEEEQANGNKQVTTSDQKKYRPEDEKLRQIELSILQQIFYHEEHANIPDSRFKRIKQFPATDQRRLAVIIFGVLLSILYLWHPEQFVSFIGLPFLDASLIKQIKVVSLLFTGWVAYELIKYLIRFFRGIGISKLNFQNAEITLDKAYQKSILNEHLDELLYFFEATQYNVLIIEDLDRFRQTEIFTKLRELNQLINNSKQINKHVVFIYAVRDEMFSDKDRTKFFDFIVPIIPVLNFSNSFDNLKRILIPAEKDAQTQSGSTGKAANEDMQLKPTDKSKETDNIQSISEILLEDISEFIDDMRLLYNITNEYFIFRETLDKDLNVNNLLAIIVYKNIFPQDFVALNSNGGELYKNIKKKDEYVSQISNQCDKSIEKLERELEVLEKIYIKDIDELRRLYVLEALASRENSYKFYDDNNTEYKPLDLLKEEHFEKLRNNSLSVMYPHRNGTTVAKLIPFSDIEKKVSSETYEQRAEQIKRIQDNQINLKRAKIHEITRKKADLPKQTIMNLIREVGIEVDCENETQKSLIKVLLENGYIDENYLDYIALFYPGKLTAIDRKFLLHLKTGRKLEYGYELQNVSNVAAQIHLSNLRDMHCLNFNLLTFLLSDGNNHKAKANEIIQCIVKNYPNTHDFITGFVNKQKEIQAFIQILSANWDDFWAKIGDEARPTQTEKDLFYGLILNYASVDSIVKMANKSNLGELIARTANFPKRLIEEKKAIDIISKLGTKFEVLDFENCTASFLDHVYENDHYALNPEMLKGILAFKNQYEHLTFSALNYAAICNSGCERTISYVESNIEKYVIDVYLKMPDGGNEQDYEYIDLLNNMSIGVETRKKIVDYVKNEVADISTIDNGDILKHLLEKAKVKATWKNIFTYCHSEGKMSLDDPIINFLNIPEVSRLLSESSISEAKTSIDLDGVMEFYYLIIQSEQITSETLSYLINQSPELLILDDSMEISVSRVAFLVYNDYLMDDDQNFAFLKGCSSALFVTFWLKTFDKRQENENWYPLELTHIREIVNADDNHDNKKRYILEKTDFNIYKEDAGTLEGLAKYLVKDNAGVPPVEILVSVLKAKQGPENRVRLLIKFAGSLHKDEIEDVLFHIGQPYEKILSPSEDITLEKTELNASLLSTLKQLNHIGDYKETKKALKITILKNEEDN